MPAFASHVPFIIYLAAFISAVGLPHASKSVSTTLPQRLSGDRPISAAVPAYTHDSTAAMRSPAGLMSQSAYVGHGVAAAVAADVAKQKQQKQHPPPLSVEDTKVGIHSLRLAS